MPMKQSTESPKPRRGALCYRMFSFHRGPGGKERLGVRKERGKSKGERTEDRQKCHTRDDSVVLHCSFHDCPWKSATLPEPRHITKDAQMD